MNIHIRNGRLIDPANRLDAQLDLFIADGKIYLGDEDGDVSVLAVGKTKKVLGEMNMGSAVYATPYPKDGVLYLLARNRVFAIKEGAKSAAK